MQQVILILPLGIWASLLGGAVGVLVTYYRSGQWRNYGRMLSEIVPAMTFSAGIAEQLLPLESEFTCFTVSLFAGAIVGFALDYWQQIGRFFVHNAFAKLSSVFTGRELPPADFDKKEPPPTPPEPVQSVAPVALHDAVKQQSNNSQAKPKARGNQQRRRKRR